MQGVLIEEEQEHGGRPIDQVPDVDSMDALPYAREKAANGASPAKGLDGLSWAGPGGEEEDLQRV